MIRLKPLLGEVVELTGDGNLRITDINDITPQQWERINHIMVQKGYTMRGPEDCKQSITNFLSNPNKSAPGIIDRDIYEQWVETIATVLNLKNPSEPTKRKYDPKRVLRSAVRQFGLTQDLNNAGYILPNGGLLYLSGTGHGRDLDHREISSVYVRLGIKVVDDADKTRGSVTPYMDAFIEDCKAIRIGGSQAHADIRNMPTRQQGIQLLKFFSMYNGEMQLDVKSKEYGKAANTYAEGTRPSRILRDIITFFNTGNLPPVPLTQDPRLK